MSNTELLEVNQNFKPHNKKAKRNNPELKTTIGTRPEWLKVKAPGGDSFQNIQKLMRSKSLHTVCEEANCPNIGECWGHGTATFMILGDTCTRSCSFCAVKTGIPETVNRHEPMDVAMAVKKMGLKHTVITSVNRDELKDQGSTIWADTVLRVKELNPGITVEVLIPDFKGDLICLDRVINSNPEILNHNIETVPRLYKKIRPQAKYQRSLDVLEYCKSRGMKTKSGIMVGIGETDDEVFTLMEDLVKIKLDIMTIGQYLQPSVNHSPVDRFVTPEQFKEFKRIGELMGIPHVESGPLVRSSYHAHEHLKVNAQK
ncbi:MAG: lipoyl synthase [Candidatus Kapabacteria bacterium]|nr:lipoyl synthase [Ignavibacteriota bacterium]MCW5884493.1 lipoyl synthase [Candidatus Kapabacteria bacterium]